MQRVNYEEEKIVQVKWNIKLKNLEWIIWDGKSIFLKMP